MDRYWDRVALAVIALVLLGGLLRQCLVDSDKKEENAPWAVSHKSEPNIQPLSIEGNNTEQIYKYILSVIAYGSHRLHFPGGEMEGGYLRGMEARRAACYVMKLQEKKCPDSEASQGGAMYYTSVCGGCHGNDGRGLNGSYPDLTRKPLLGLQNRERRDTP